MIGKMIERNGQDVEILHREHALNEYDDMDVTETTVTETKAIIKTPSEDRQVEIDGRMSMVELEAVIRDDIDVNLIGDGTADIFRFTFGTVERQYRAVSRRYTKHPYNDLTNQVIGLKKVQRGQEVNFGSD